MRKLIKRIQQIILLFYNSPARRILIGVYLLAVVGGLSWTLWQRDTQQAVLVAEIGNSYETSGRMSEEMSQAQMQLIELQSINDKLYDEYLIASAAAKAARELAMIVPAPLAVTAPINNTLPGDGYSRQAVATDRGNFVVSMVVATGARVVVDTASDGDCGNNCPALPLSDYVSRNSAFAGINGSYFCPPDYARCQDKINTFDTLVFNGRTKTAHNQSNNVYSVVPLVAAYGGNLNFYRRTLEWGVDSGSTGALANHPLLLQGGSIAFDEGSLEAYQRDGKGTKGFIGTRGGSIIIGHVYGATVPEAAQALLVLGLENALNLDGGGSSSLWYGGYKVGPGRALPNAILLVK